MYSFSDKRNHQVIICTAPCDSPTTAFWLDADSYHIRFLSSLLPHTRSNISHSGCWLQILASKFNQTWSLPNLAAKDLQFEQATVLLSNKMCKLIYERKILFNDLPQLISVFFTRLSERPRSFHRIQILLPSILKWCDSDWLISEWLKPYILKTQEGGYYTVYCCFQQHYFHDKTYTVN